MTKPITIRETTCLLAVLCTVMSPLLILGSPPNIIFIVGDDLGWNDVSWHNPVMITPNLEKFARSGVILNSSYVQYYCSPSRNSFMTGYFPYHTGLQHDVISAGEPRYVPANFTMLPEVLRTAGYKTHIVGKWHLGMCNWKYTPTYRGFDSYFGYYDGTEDYYTHMTGDGYDLRSNTSVAKDPSDTHFNYLFTQKAIEVIEGHDPNTPLFLYLPFHLVHDPLQVPEKYENMYKSIETVDRRVYCGMVSMMDESFGNITAALDRAGLLDNALLIFTTDNGGPVIHAANNWPLRGAKTTFWEGGTRGVAFVWSKNLVSKAGTITNEMMHAVDWFPTILHLAGAEAPSDIDGVNQWEMLSQGAASNRFEFVYNIDTIMNSTAIRYKDYKLMTGSPGNYNDWYPLPKFTGEESGQFLFSNNSERDSQWGPQLFNIRNDPEERVNLADSEPEMLQFMMARLHKWMVSGVPPQNAPVDPKSDPKNWGGVWTPGWC
ncbi:arylsulfatase B-like [Pomacea canaliculata]|uniref:arylsulfatase B-like n=1 Tax=Pomacea canaliculata TaxID=400727 RepID=UPI000D732D4C|nr:arylsulfatase B-like [Pomacea canaliculata]